MNLRNRLPLFIVFLFSIFGFTLQQCHVDVSGSGTACTLPNPCSLDFCTSENATEIILLENTYTLTNELVFRASTIEIICQQGDCVFENNVTGFITIAPSVLSLKFDQVKFNECDGFLNPQNVNAELELLFFNNDFTFIKSSFFRSNSFNSPKIEFNNSKITDCVDFFQIDSENPLNLTIKNSEIVRSVSPFSINSKDDVFIKIVNSKFQNCTKNGFGGVMSIQSEYNQDLFFQIIIQNSRFEFNEAKKGGSLFVYNMFGRVQLLISDSVFRYNTANTLGGAIYVYVPFRYVIINGENNFFERNLAESNGGAVFIFATLEYAKYISQNSRYSFNKARRGGAVYAFSSSGCVISELYGENFTNNHAHVYGGAIRLESQSDLVNISLSKCNFISNYGEMGGAISVETGGITYCDIVDSLFSSNFGEFSAGVMLLATNLYLIVKNSEFSNHIGQHYGAFYTDCVTQTMFFEKTHFINNVGETGGDISSSISSNLYFDVHNCTFLNSSGINGGSLYLASSRFYYSDTFIEFNVIDSYFSGVSSSQEGSITYVDSNINLYFFNNQIIGNNGDSLFSLKGKSLANFKQNVWENNNVEVSGIIFDNVGCYEDCKVNCVSNLTITKDKFIGSSSGKTFIYTKQLFDVVFLKDVIFNNIVGESVIEMDDFAQLILFSNVEILNSRPVRILGKKIEILNCRFSSSYGCLEFKKHLNDKTLEAYVVDSIFTQCNLNFKDVQNLYVVGGKFYDTRFGVNDPDLSVLLNDPILHSTKITEFTHNYNTQSRAIELERFNSFRANNIHVFNNTYGGLSIFFNDQEEFIMEKSLISHNMAEFGGGFLLSGNAENILEFYIDEDCLVSYNSADYGGGYFFDLSKYASPEDLRISSSITNNHASLSGGAAYVNHGNGVGYKDNPVPFANHDTNTASNGNVLLGSISTLSVKDNNPSCSHYPDKVYLFNCVLYVQIQDYQDNYIIEEPFGGIESEIDVNVVEDDMNDEVIAQTKRFYFQSSDTWGFAFSLEFDDPTILKKKLLTLNVTAKRKYSDVTFKEVNVRMIHCKWVYGSVCGSAPDQTLVVVVSILSGIGALFVIGMIVFGVGFCLFIYFKDKRNQEVYIKERLKGDRLLKKMKEGEFPEFYEEIPSTLAGCAKRIRELEKALMSSGGKERESVITYRKNKNEDINEIEMHDIQFKKPKMEQGLCGCFGTSKSDAKSLECSGKDSLKENINRFSEIT